VSVADARARSAARERRGVADGVDKRNDAADDASARGRRGNTSEARAPTELAMFEVSCALRVKGVELVSEAACVQTRGWQPTLLTLPR
jgi:hypothetical protein